MRSRAGWCIEEGYEMNFALPERSARLLRHYLEDYRQVLCQGPGDWLFPGRGDGHRSCSRLRDQIRSTVRENTGLLVSPDLFRHLAAKLMLEAETGAYDVVRRLLGHTRLSSTKMMYANLISAALGASIEGG